VTVGILGGGQLGRMLALAGIPLGLRFRFLDPDPEAPCAQIAEQILAPYDDPAALDKLAAGAEVVTYEFENVPAQVAQRLEAHAKVHPPAAALAALQDRLLEKSLFVECGVEVPAYEPVSTREELMEAVERLGMGKAREGETSGLVIKSRRFGYDGKGQAVLRPAGASGEALELQIENAWKDVAPRAQSGGLIVERFVNFSRELSLVGVRGRDGSTRFYPLVQNHHSRGILRTTIAPAPDLAPGLQQVAEDRARAIMENLGYVGVLAIEFFESKDAHGRPVLLGNEMAPRVHNTGHWTIEGARTSQFECHLRAILGLPAGDTTMRAPVAAMINILGRFPRTSDILSIPGAHLHHYGKSERPGRKIGHITVLGDTHEQLGNRIARVEHALPAQD
jgi:5-(carboxyamino)imidazole ribonucleotide synthase